jgi:hypothetical protein
MYAAKKATLKHGGDRSKMQICIMPSLERKVVIQPLFRFGPSPPRCVADHCADRRSDSRPIACIALAEPAKPDQEGHNIAVRLNRVHGPALALAAAVTPLRNRLPGGVVAGSRWAVKHPAADQSNRSNQ